MNFNKRVSIIAPIFVLSSILFASPVSADTTIYQATDLHYISQSLTDNGSAFTQVVDDADGKVTLYCDPLVRAFADEVIAEDPDYLLITGDLTFNGELQSHKDLAELFRTIEEAGHTQVLVFPGNHDLNYTMARKYEGDELFLTDTCSAPLFEEIYADFGYSEAIKRDPSSLSYVYELNENTWLLCMDANTEESPYILTENELAWAEEVLKEAAAKDIHVISASHQNLLAHNSIFIDGYVMGGASDLLSLYAQYGVELNLSGHMHMQHISQSVGVTDIATSSLSVAPCQYAALTISENAATSTNTASPSITYRTRQVDVSSWAAANGLTDPNLLDFQTYAAGYFAQIGSSKTATTLEDKEIPDEARQQLIDDTNRLNAAYFSGRMDTITDFDQILEEWQTYAPADFFLIYVLSLKNDKFEDLNSWSN